MSGGHFSYRAAVINDLADELSESIDNAVNDDLKCSYSTRQSLIDTVKILRVAYTRLHRADWLLSCDDGEDDYHRRLAEDLEKLK